MKSVIIYLIRFYQKTISPNHGGRNYFPTIGCKYYPSCSEYAVLSIQKHGIIKGAVYGAWRILRCNPFSNGGIDEIK